MLKGCQRQMIKISGRADSVFEEAYFIMKPQSFKNIMTERDLVLEANRIIKEMSCRQERKFKKSVRVSPLLFLGMLIMSAGGLISAFIWIFV